MESWQTPSEPRDSTNSRTNGHDVHPGVMPWEALLTFGSELVKNVSLGFNHEETDKSRAWTFYSWLLLVQSAGRQHWPSLEAC